MKNFLKKMKGVGSPPPRVGFTEIGLAFVGSCLAIGLIGILNSYFFKGWGLVLLIGSFGASAVLVFGAFRSPLAQPRNVLGGHIVSALVGVIIFKIFGEHWVSAALAVSLAIVCMHLTLTLHPPGGATALIAVTGGSQIYNLGFLFVLVPCALGAIIMLLVALFVNNLSEKHQYPQFWW